MILDTLVLRSAPHVLRLGRYSFRHVCPPVTSLSNAQAAAITPIVQSRHYQTDKYQHVITVAVS